MDNNKLYYSKEEYTANKIDIANAFVALHFANGLSSKQREDISHCLSLLNDFLEALNDGKVIVYEQDEKSRHQEKPQPTDEELHALAKGVVDKLTNDPQLLKRYKELTGGQRRKVGFC